MKRIRFSEGADHRGSARAGGRSKDGRSGAQSRHLGIHASWRNKYGSMNVADAKGLRSLLDEDRKMKKLLAESMLDQAALKELLTREW